MTTATWTRKGGPVNYIFLFTGWVHFTGGIVVIPTNNWVYIYMKFLSAFIIFIAAVDFPSGLFFSKKQQQVEERETLLEAPSLALQNAKMALQEQLDRFKKQQEKCQSTLTTAPPSTSARAPAPPVKFSNDTERLQHINSIRKAPAGAQIKRVIDLLLETRQAFTPEQINDHCYVDMNSNKAVFDSLRNNLKVHYDGKRFSYKSKHDLKDKSQLLVLIRKFPEGIAVIDLKDAYPNVMDDLQALKAVGQIWLLSNFDSQEDIAYPNDPRMDLQKNGMKPATNTAKRRAAAQVQGISTKQKAKKKKHEISKRTKLTNAHLPELFKNLGS
ncbi:TRANSCRIPTION INITIATION FACTOR IIE BETA SUBUNIT [Salix purpurea]|uniref:TRANSCRIPTION INITIATION FACTOR IIE BETA SUBUNIT n=1 Tax=Salix purpurea TaxID=77065 RepID=A0A9Q0YW85_SALPP|nr:TRANSCRIPTION INITIATION FACTOR IIE BETA SUBUNIT [Salix purpurea]